jgi:hypothetical protein
MYRRRTVREKGSGSPFRGMHPDTDNRLAGISDKPKCVLSGTQSFTGQTALERCVDQDNILMW